MGAYCSGDQYYAQVRECYLTAESYYQHRVFFTEDQCDYCWEVFIVGNHLHQEVHTQGCPLNGPVDKCPY